jgi:hypothetical protein
MSDKEMMGSRFLPTLLIGIGLPAFVSASSDESWRKIEALDAGPRQKPASREETVLLARNHFLLQRKALEEFLRRYPSDARAPQARLRLAEISATEGMMDNNARGVKEALAAMGAVEGDASAPADVRADAGFRRASILMQTAPGGPEAGYKQVVAAARQFAANHPADIRGARLLVEAATTCDAKPALKRELLDEAEAATGEDALLNRIADDRRRLDLLGTQMEMSLPSLQGPGFDISSFRGKPVILVFWSSESPQSLLRLRDLREAWPQLKKAGVAVATVNLDTSAPAAMARAEAMDAPWPTGHEEGGWMSPTARRLGINALPTLIVLDAKGTVISINARTNAEALASSLAGQ